MNHDESVKRATLFHTLHKGDLLLLPNIWDPLGAALVERLGYSAIATASASVSFTNGYEDGERLPFTSLLAVVKSIVTQTSLPVTVDMESGYSSDIHRLKDNIKHLVDAGVSGINIEDYNHEKNAMRSTTDQCERLQAIVEVAKSEGIPLFINARTDVYLRPGKLTEDEKLAEAIERGLAYERAGAHGLFVPAMMNEAHLQSIVTQIGLPVNVLMLPGAPGLDKLKAMGVRRVSFGPGLLRIAMNAIQSFLEQLPRDKNVEAITQNPLTTGALAGLLRKK